jgi:hypothetical protein
MPRLRFAVGHPEVSAVGTDSAGATAGVFAASPRKKEEIQIATPTAWSTVHGLTVLTLDGLAATVAPNVNNVAKKLVCAVSHGLFRK